ncbi:MAG: GspH/FimT family pseudopilin [Steroidobacteraceae bacterium]
MNPSHIHPEPAMPRYGGGFTMVELVVTLLVASILAALGAPAFNRFVMNNRLASQTNDLVSAIQLTRSEAIKRNAGLRLCRTNSATANNCAGSIGSWENWIVRTVAGTGGSTVIRRGMVNTYGGTLTVNSNFTADIITFGSDGLARSGGNLINAGLNDDNVGFHVCSTSRPTENIRDLVLGVSSRITIEKKDGSC